MNQLFPANQVPVHQVTVGIANIPEETEANLAPTVQDWSLRAINPNGLDDANTDCDRCYRGGREYAGAAFRPLYKLLARHSRRVAINGVPSIF